MCQIIGITYRNIADIADTADIADIVDIVDIANIALSKQAWTRCQASSQGASAKRANGDFPCRA